MLIIIRKKAVYSKRFVSYIRDTKIVSNKSSQIVDNFFKISNKRRIFLMQIASGKGK